MRTHVVDSWIRLEKQFPGNCVVPYSTIFSAFLHISVVFLNIYCFFSWYFVVFSTLFHCTLVYLTVSLFSSLYPCLLVCTLVYLSVLE